MRRRDFLKTSGLAAAALGVGNAAEAAAELARPSIITRIVELTVVSPWQNGRGGFPESVAHFVQRLHAAAGPRLRLRTNFLSQDSFDAVTSGAADLYFGPAQTSVAHHPGFAYFAGLPGQSGLAPDALAGWLQNGGGQALWDEMSDLFGVKSILVGHTGPAPGFWSTRRIRSLSDISAEQIYAAGLAREVVKGLGAKPSSAAPSEVTGKLARAEIFAAEWGSAAQSMAAGFPSIAKFCTASAITQQGSALALTVRRSTWDRFEPALQNAITTVAGQEFSRSLADSRDGDATLRRALSDALQIGFLPMPGDVSAAIDRISGAVVADVATLDGLAGRINQSYLDFRRRTPAT